MPSSQEIINRINKKYGPGTVVLGSDLREITKRITTGSLAFDAMLGGGGWPVNQWNEIIGSESSGKTTMALKTIAANQEMDPDFTGLWVDSEGFVPSYARLCGVDLHRLHVVPTNVMEEAFQIALEFLEAREIDILVIDSLPQLVPGEEAEKAMADFQVGLGARLTGKFMRKSGKAQRRSLTEDDRDCTCILINQWREKVGVMYGDNRTTPGGMAKNYACFTRVEVRREDWILAKPNGDKVGQTIKAQTIKNKSAPPRRVAAVDFYFVDKPPNGQEGCYDRIQEIVNLALFYEVITRRGAFYTFGDDRWQGKEAVHEQAKYDLTLQEALSAAVLAAAGRNGAPAPDPAPEAPAPVQRPRKAAAAKATPPRKMPPPKKAPR